MRIGKLLLCELRIGQDAIFSLTIKVCYLHLRFIDAGASVETMMISRRKLVKGFSSLVACWNPADVVHGAVSGAGQKASVDVLVVGAGGAGLAAAVSAAEKGLAVLVLEKCLLLAAIHCVLPDLLMPSTQMRKEMIRLIDSFSTHGMLGVAEANRVS